MKRLIHKISLCLIVFASVTATIAAQDVRVQESRKAKLEREIAIIDKQLAENASQSKSALSQLTLIRKKIANRRALVDENNRLIKQYDNQIRNSEREIAKMQAKIDTLEVYYSRLVRTAYKNRDAKIWYMYILASENLGQAFRRYNYFRTLSSTMGEQADNIRKVQEELEAEKVRLLSLRADQEAVLAQRKAELVSLEKEEAQSKSVVNQLNRNKSKYQKELANKRKEVEALNREIKRLVAAAMKPGEGQKAVEVDYKLAGEFSANKGKLPWPANGPIVDAFGQHYHPVYTKIKLPFNNGIGIALASGTEIKAVFDGVVKQIVVMPGYNQCVLVQHGNYFTFYCKLKSTTVRAGDKVKTGQVLGVVDTINGETQLHFQIWKDQTPQNPELWLR